MMGEEGVPVLFVIETRGRVCVERLSALKSEREVLFTAGSFFTVKAVEVVGDMHVIRLGDMEKDSPVESPAAVKVSQPARLPDVVTGATFSYLSSLSFEVLCSLP